MDITMLLPSPPSTVFSPCTSNCRIDPATGWCEGCGRSRDEIRDWLCSSDEEKRTILARIAARQAGAGQE
jgi:predicted Fe-S protein YdhL (DUF1289 family)